MMWESSKQSLLLCSRRTQLSSMPPVLCSRSVCPRRMLIIASMFFKHAAYYLNSCTVQRLLLLHAGLEAPHSPRRKSTFQQTPTAPAAGSLQRRRHAPCRSSFSSEASHAGM